MIFEMVFFLLICLIYIFFGSIYSVYFIFVIIVRIRIESKRSIFDKCLIVLGGVEFFSLVVKSIIEEIKFKRNFL